MSSQLITHMEKFVNLSPEDRFALVNYFKSIAYKKKELLLSSEDVCRSTYFVIKGCLRMYFITEKGVEQTMQFALENWWISDYMAFTNQQRTEFYIQAVEATEVLVIDYHSLELLYQQVPVTERYFRLVYQKMAAAAQQRAKYFQDFSKEEIYNHFNKRFPEFIQRVPQYLIASYLGFTPEYLSEIRKKNLS
ncbi:Crp/Fnr family transcriptional regulator [Pedobacter duraquae]|uniref:CRP-like cAMP-binding protein n=1 Tax=Pedobacter duraquae TaxID=425511 RepID=A0A4R6ID54_9SPHI|nr:Crp/Fnr family transcriptional regulator [Pedobacter duraquae]TDO20193.1 CRP-like cAMP-binding protein [Pedobacter duraquae]